MGVPLNLQDIQSGFLSASAFNANNELIEQALNRALDRTGSSDNAMEVDLDMGLFNINNVADAFLKHQAVSYGQAQNILSASSDQVTSTADIETFISTAGQTTFTFSNIEYIQNVNALLVFINGVYQLAATDYIETTPTSIEFNVGLEAGDIVTVLGARFNAEVFVTESQANANEAETSANNASSSATTSSNFADEAEHWANHPEDTLVPEGDLVDDYSALHWARKSEEAAGYKLGINNQAGTAYTLVASDEGDLVRMTNSGANTVTVPTNASVPFEVGTIVNIRQSGTGTTTISPDTGVTINAPNDEFTTDGQEFGIAIVKVATDEWDLVKSYAGVRTDDFEADITATTGSSGYQKLPSGLIWQWGSGLGDGAYAFPIAFPNACINVFEQQRTGGGQSDNFIFNVSATGFSIGDMSGNDFFWFAVGV